MGTYAQKDKEWHSEREIERERESHVCAWPPACICPCVCEHSGCCGLPRPLLRIPTLAIHLDRSVNTDGFKFNLERELLPMFALKAGDAKKAAEDDAVRLPAPLLQLLARQLDCDRTCTHIVIPHVDPTHPQHGGGSLA
jgi:hypothetical protein